MKSIKEKAENIYPDKKVVLGRGNTCLSCGRVKRESFVAGAKYVLDEIEQVVQGDLNSHSAFKLKCIKQIVEQLKSNQ